MFRLITVCAIAATLMIHPHEHRVVGTVAKVQLPYFDVADKTGDKTLFMIVPATEIFVGKAKGTTADITVGRSILAEGEENDRGVTEAKMVHLSGS